MPIRPQDRFAGQPISARDQRASNDQHRQAQLTVAGHARLSRGPGGTVIYVPKPPPVAQKRSTPVVRFPFQIYQYSAGNPVSDWRTFRVRRGYSNSQAPSNDDASGAPITVVVPASSTLYKFWLEITIQNDPTVGNYGIPTGLSINHGADGWSGYPGQPDFDTDTGQPAAMYYVLIGEITTSADTAGTVAQPSQNLQRNINVDLVAYLVTCGEGGMTFLSRLSARGL